MILCWVLYIIGKIIFVVLVGFCVMYRVNTNRIAWQLLQTCCPTYTYFEYLVVVLLCRRSLKEWAVTLISRRPPGEAVPTSAPVMIIGANNVFEVDCCSEALKIGDNNVLEVKCLYKQSNFSDRLIFRYKFMATILKS